MDAVHSHHLIDILALLFATVIIVPIFHKLRLDAILGYLTAGAILGPWCLSVITEREEIRYLAEFGVIFLLFILGIELNPKKLWQMRQLVIVLGLSQLLITSAVIYAFCLSIDLPKQTAIIIDFGLPLSSTVSETLEVSLRLTKEVLLNSGISTQETERVIHEFREDYYLDIVRKVTENKVVMGELSH